MRPEIDCPNGCGEMEVFYSAKDIELSSAQGNEITVRRFYILACPKCYYEEKTWSE